MVTEDIGGTGGDQSPSFFFTAEIHYDRIAGKLTFASVRSRSDVS